MMFKVEFEEFEIDADDEEDCHNQILDMMKKGRIDYSIEPMDEMDDYED